MKNHTYIYAFVAFIVSSCSTIKNSTFNKEIITTQCTAQEEYNYTALGLPSYSSISISDSSLLSKKISSNNLLIATTIGITPILAEYITLKTTVGQNASLEQRVRLLELKHTLDHKINNASLIISAVSAELDCEEERIKQIANYIIEKQENLESKLTIAAIVVGASGAILTSGVIKNDKAGNAVGITAGVAEAGLGFAMLFNKKKIRYQQQRNILKDIWQGPDVSKFFPPFIWYYLNYSIDKSPSPREEIIDKWEQFGHIEKDSKKMTDLFFGPGGKYTADQLNDRAAMYDQLESRINLLKQKLMLLSYEIDNI
ncbi:hypothetical protein [Sphingobacterium rhinopitheci]|uniref:hypothetical protein n=1 Tax=Sphingobacterium rhinopitheci TaxID=2781960 RepID=UPI001F51EDF1|nr:hypothetical protein [Sphingobacterium rhinopitheci]MCI0922253.1 hypothetical protein [Sphingobacterium rhinopitheci]